MADATLSPNWAILKQKLAAGKRHKKNKTTATLNDLVDVVQPSESSHSPKLTKAVAIDCEMVGTGVTGRSSMLARVSVVNEKGECLYDEFVKPKDYITDLRTPVSGIRLKDITTGKELSVVQKEVFDLFNGKIVVGHALKHDFKALLMSHPKRDMRDTALYKPFRRMNKGSTPSLRKLAKHFLGKTIQQGEHSSVEDARAAMQIYVMHKREWEESVRNAVAVKRKLTGKLSNVQKKLKPKNRIKSNSNFV